MGNEVFERVYEMDTPSRSHYMFDFEGNIIAFFGTLFWPESNENKEEESKKKKI